MVLREGTGICLDIIFDMTNLYRYDNGIYVDDFVCTVLLHGYMEQSGERPACKTRDHFTNSDYVFGTKCLTVSECAGHGTAYETAHTCVDVPPETTGDYALTPTGNGAYRCDKGYIDITQNTARCIDQTECAGFLSESRKLCYSEERCKADETMYACTYASRSWCLNVLECEKKGGRAYSATKTCEMKEPNRVANCFDAEDLKKHVHTCKKANEVQLVLDLSGEKAQCISANECRFGTTKRIVRDG